MKKVVGISFVILLLLMGSIADSKKITTNNDIEKKGTISKQEWTLMVYLDGDNNLQNYMDQSIDWLEFNGYNSNVNIVAQFDSYSLFDGIRRYKVTENGAEIIGTLEEKSMGSQETLVNFVSWAKNNYPAKKYCLVLSDHGVGWRNGFLRDETDVVDNKPDYLSMEELKIAMNKIKRDILDDDKLNLLVLDACQMSMIEVYYQIRGTTKLCLASPDLITGGSPFHMIIDDLYENIGCNETILAEYFYQAYNSYYYSVSLAIYNIDNLISDFIDTLSAFSSELLENYKNCKNEIKKAIKNTKAYNGVGGYKTHFRDIYDFADEISKVTSNHDLKIKADKLKVDLKNCKLHPSDACRLSIYLPVFNLQYPFESSYSDLDLCKDTSWYDFVLKSRYLKYKGLNKIIMKYPLIKEVLSRFFLDF